MKAHVFVDDIADMYPTFVASRERAITNAMAIESPAKDCEHMVAYKRFAKEAKRLEGARHYREALGLDACNVSNALTKTIGPPTKLFPCVCALAMGDLNAVDYATGAHENVLLSGGALPPDKRLRHGQPIPRGDLLHALVIDDHVGIIAGIGLIDSRVQNMAAEFDLGTDACAKAGLPQHPTKRVRDDVNAVILGAEVVDGQTIGSERVRRMFLAVIFLCLRELAGRMVLFCEAC